MPILGRYRHHRRPQYCLKRALNILLAILFFAFLFRKSLFTKTATPTISENSSNQISLWEYSEENRNAIEDVLQQRKNHLYRMCQRYNLESQYSPNSQEFFVCPEHNLIWCNVFKAASSMWMYYFNILAGYNAGYLHSHKEKIIALARKRFPCSDIEELRYRLPSSLSFFFVRDPFVRLISAYRNKIEGDQGYRYHPLRLTNERQLLTYFLVDTSYSEDSLYEPTFEDFVRLIIYQHTTNISFDQHWTPVYSFCTPCSVDFTIIGKVETFERDSEYIIRQAGLEYLLLEKLPNNELNNIANMSNGTTSYALSKTYFSQIDCTTLKQLLNIYRLDFELFNYNYEKYFQWCRRHSLSAKKF